MSHVIGNVANEAEVETKAIQESVVGDAQNPRYRGRGEIVKEIRGAGAERDVPVAKGDCNWAQYYRRLSAEPEHCLIPPYRFSGVLLYI